jgi:hypothetical protein
VAWRRRDAASEELVDEQVVRDAEESLVAALQESDTAVEALGDSGMNPGADGSRRRWTIGIAGSLLALLGIMVARRRR